MLLSKNNLVSGENRAIFNEVEIDVVNNLELETAMGVTKDLIFMNGKVITPRNDTTVSLDFINYDAYAGEDDTRHVDGYTSIRSNEQFVFPIGDDDRLRPMIAPTQNQFFDYKGAYFFEDPNTPNTFSTSFATTDKHFEIETVSTYEFWDLNGNTETSITLTWDTLSNLNLITPSLEQLIVVGWNVDKNRWESLGNTNTTGDITSGTVSSISFIPNQYEVITLGSESIISDNYYISPNNGDNHGETLYFLELEEYPVSHLVIFNRWGNIVFERDNYQNDFNGISDGRATLQKQNKLPTGTYFYELNFGETEFTEFKKGWVYIGD